MNVLGLIPARGGSRGLPGKNTRDLLGKPVIAYTIEAGLAASRIDKLVVSSDDSSVKDICRGYEVAFLERPPGLASDTARIDDVMRQVYNELKENCNYQADIIVLLYANVPVRAAGIIDRAVGFLVETGADSVQTVAPVGKFHPYWLYQVEEAGKANKYIDNQVYQRQDLPPLYVLDGAVGAVRAGALLAARGSENPHAFWGQDRRCLIQGARETVDIDCLHDFYLAEAILRATNETLKFQA